MTGSQQQPASNPSGLGLPGKRLWRRGREVLQPREDELLLLDQAARVADTVALLEAGFKGAPLIVAGSMGQQSKYPLLSGARQQRGQLARFLAQLKLPDEDGRRTRGTQACKPAQARWSRPPGA